MARINVEDSLFKDGRFIELMISMGSRHAALGAVVEAFMLAQEFYLSTETNRLIPLSEWKRRKAVDLIIECGLAEIHGDFVYVCGSEKQFGWLIQRQFAGQKGGRPKKAAESGRLAAESGSNPLSLTLSLTQDNINNNNTNNTLHDLILIWNDHATNLSKVKKTNETRNKKIKAIWPKLKPEEWVEVVKRINASDFCTGKIKEWKADFDFLLQKETYLKTMEGKYDNRTSKGGRANFTQRDTNATDEFAELNRLAAEAAKSDG